MDWRSSSAVSLNTILCATFGLARCYVGIAPRKGVFDRNWRSRIGEGFLDLLADMGNPFGIVLVDGNEKAFEQCLFTVERAQARAHDFRDGSVVARADPRLDTLGEGAEGDGDGFVGAGGHELSCMTKSYKYTTTRLPTSRDSSDMDRLPRHRHRRFLERFGVRRVGVAGVGDVLAGGAELHRL